MSLIDGTGKKGESIKRDIHPRKGEKGSGGQNIPARNQISEVLGKRTKWGTHVIGKTRG